MNSNFENQLRKFILLIYFLCLLILPEQKVKAYTEARMLINGDFTFTTTDTAATTNTTWETIGFTVRRNITNGNPIKDNEYAIFKLKAGQRIEGGVGDNGKKKVTFFLTKEQVNDALEGTALESIQDNDDLYLNGIIKVHNGKNGPGPYKTLDGIKNAEDWKDTKDFADRFDVHVYYRAGDQEYPVTITSQLYQSGKYVPIETKDYVDQNGKDKFINHTEITLPYTVVPKTRKDAKGETYYLYRVYYQNLPETKKLGNRKITADPNVDKDAYDEDLKYLIRNRRFYVKGSNNGDKLNIVAIYRRFPKVDGYDDFTEVTREYEEIAPTAVIAADTRKNEAYEVSEGIPGTESLYANAFTSKYMAGSVFIRKFGTKVYPVDVTRTYVLTYSKYNPGTKKKEPFTERVPITYHYFIKRDYSYWEIKSLGVYAIDHAIMNNGALPGGRILLKPAGYTQPAVTFIHSEKEEDHLIQPGKEKEAHKVSLPDLAVSGSSVPGYEYKEEAEAAVQKIKCKNDKLVFNGTTIISDAVKEEKTQTPKEIPSGLEEVGENVLYLSNLTIPAVTANGEYDSNGTVTYKPVAMLNPIEVETMYELQDLNSVTVHTPTVCDAKVENRYQDNQMINPDKSRAALVLDRPFYVTLPTTGLHRFIKGYEYRDYSKYIDAREVKFPFDIYRGTPEKGSFLSAGTWAGIGTDTLFYLPAWVNEGKYTIEFRSTAINAGANAGMGKTEALANIELDHYTATDTVDVEVSGRLYGLSLYDISDYPVWEKVFRKPNSLALSGFKYTLGDKDQNGEDNHQNSRYTLALVNGSHPRYRNIGVVKTGYVTRFSLKTIGNMYKDQDYIRIIPTFYYVNSKGKLRQEADVYYSETFLGKRNVMVKMGSALDMQNKKSLRTGDPYLAIAETELMDTAAIKGVPIKDLKAQMKQVFTFTNIRIPDTLRTFTGDTKNLPESVPGSLSAKSVQNWYGEYYLPSEIHVAPKDFDIKAYIKKHGGLNYKEPFWLKNGYVIINFQIETIQDGVRHLSYINAENAEKGYCNMWKREGYQYEKIDNTGTKFTFRDGDYIMYDTDQSAAKDYITAGTH